MFYRDLVEPLLRSTSTVPPVQMGILRLASGKLRLLWPGSEPGYRVETTANPTGDSWVDLGLSSAITNNQYFVTVPAAESAQFFRLVKP